MIDVDPGRYQRVPVPAKAMADSPAVRQRQTAAGAKEEHDDEDFHNVGDDNNDVDDVDDDDVSESASSTPSHAHDEDHMGTSPSPHTEVRSLKSVIKLLQLRLRTAKKKHRKNKKDRSASHLIHVHAHASPLSSDAVTPPDFRGIFNLMGIIVVVSNLRLIIENALKYGLIVGSIRYPETQVSIFGLAVFAGVMLGNVVMALAAERLCASGGRTGAAVGTLLHVINCGSPLVTTLAIAWSFKIGAFVSINIAMAGVVVHLKLISFAHTNHDMRVNKKAPYPANLTAKNLAQFMTFPTLVYQASYVTRSSVRSSIPSVRWMSSLCDWLC